MFFLFTFSLSLSLLMSLFLFYSFSLSLSFFSLCLLFVNSCKAMLTLMPDILQSLEVSWAAQKSTSLRPFCPRPFTSPISSSLSTQFHDLSSSFCKLSYTKSNNTQNTDKLLCSANVIYFNPSSIERGPYPSYIGFCILLHRFIFKS